VVPRKLEAALPFKSKAKLQRAKNPDSYLARRAVVLEPEDRQRRALVQMVSAVAAQKTRKRKLTKETKLKQHVAELQRDSDRFSEVRKEERKRKYREMGKKAEERSAKRSA
jgi:ribosome biogenesis protein BMS1